MSREQSVIVNNREVVLLSGTLADSDSKLRKAAKAIHDTTGALVLLDHDGTLQLDRLSTSKMREAGWVRVEELNQALEQLGRATA